MPGLDYPVHLSRSAPFDIGCDQIVFYDVVEADAMCRSSVLSCVAEGVGEAKLPDSVTVSDFRKWLTAVGDTEAVFRNRPFASMCTIIKVADAVDDMLMDRWVRIAAEGLDTKRLCWCEQKTKDDILQGLLLLPHQLRQRVLVAAAFDPVQLDSLLYFFPTGLHAEVLAAMTTPTGCLQMPLTSKSGPALQALASLPASPPSVLALQIDNRTAKLHENQVDSEVWTCLRQALQHHSGLTSLVLCPSPSTATFSQSNYLPGVALLTSLRYLDLQGCMSREDSTTALHDTLRDLNQLHSLRLKLSQFSSTSHITSSQKRPRDEDEPAPHCLASILSAATALTFLHIHVAQQDSSQGQHACFTAAAPLHMPQLVQLKAIFDDDVLGAFLTRRRKNFTVDVELAACFLSQLSAPLTSLALGEEGLQHQQLVSSDAAERLIRNLATFTQLSCLTAGLPAVELSSSGARDALISGLPDLVEALPQLQSISISAESAVIEHLMPLLGSTTTLTKLHLWGIDAGSASEEFWHHVRRPQLLDLSLYFLPRPPVESEISLAVVSSLTQLTALRLCGFHGICHDAHCQALAGMTGLQALCLGGDAGSDGGTKVPAPCIASLHALSALTSLAVITPLDEDPFSPKDAIGNGLAEQELPELQELKLALYEPFEMADQLASYVATLPALDRLTVLLRDSGLWTGRVPFDGDEPHELSQEECHRATKDRISSAAEAAGVELSMEAD